MSARPSFKPSGCMQVVLILLSVCILASGAWGQAANTGSLQGTVIDVSTAVVPDATVQLHNVRTGAEISTRSDRAGQYDFENVPVGEYSLSVDRSGFKKAVHAAFFVHASENLRINVTLQVGTTSEQIEVTSAPPVVDTVSASEGNTVTGAQINNLPLTNRVFTQMVSLEPGVVAPVDERPGFGSNSSVGFSINGVRADENNLMIDGVRNVDTFGGNAFVAPNLYAVEEFRIQSNDYSAAAGRSAGGQINLISRAGTNAFHGNVFEFFRNDVMNAMAKDSTTKSKERYNDFGFDVGGPILKNKLFFFWSEEWRRIINAGGPNITWTPTQAERNGDFWNSRVKPIDPTTGQPFPDNQIPADRIDPNAQLLLNTYWPQPIPGYVAPNDLHANYESEAPDYTRWREDSIRVDYNITNNLLLYGRYTQDSVNLDNPYGLWGENPFPYVGGSTQNFPIYNTSVHLVWTPRPNFMTEFSWGVYFANDKALKNGALSSKDRASGLSLKEVFPLNEGNRVPTMYLNGDYTGIVEEWFFHNDAFSVPFTFHATWTKNRHIVRFGVDVTPEGKSELANPSSNNTNGTYIFTGDATGVYDASGTEVSQGNPIADMLLGKTYNYSETALDPFGKYRWINVEPYVEDQFKLLQNLTVTAGVRYEWFQTEYEKHDMLGTFIPSRFNPANAAVVDQWGEITSPGDPLNGIVIAGKNSPYGRSVFPGHSNALAPRIGIAWDPTNSGKTSIRAGYGIFYDRWGSYSQFGANNPPFNQTVSIYNTSLSNPGGTAGATYPAGLNAVLAPWKYPSVQKWSLSVQREVFRDTTASVAYVGTKGTHLLGNYNLNQPDPNPLIANWTISPDYVRPYKGYSGITGYTTEFGSNYNALQAELIHRLTKGLAFQAVYTWSKALTDSSGTWAFPQDSRNWRAEYGPADFDQRHIFTTNFSYDLPFFQRSSNRLTRVTLGGWQLSGIVTYQSGGPMTMTLLGDWAGVGSWNERAEIVGDPTKAGPVAANPDCVAPTSVHNRAHWFNPCAFMIPTAGTFGNSSRGVLYGPGLENWDLGLMKQFKFTERINLQFRAEAFNTFNTPGRGGVNATADDVNFSKMSGGNSPRILQLSLALAF